MLIGYARVSTDDQNLDLQLSAHNAAGCEQIYTDKVSGTKATRPGLDEAFSHLRSGDTLVVWRLDRLGRSLRHLIDTVTTLQEREIGFKSLQESIDTTTSGSWSFISLVHWLNLSARSSGNEPKPDSLLPVLGERMAAAQKH